MGGFTVNGFGATDRFVPIRNLGTFQCPHCKQERMLQLMEVQRKVSLLYIQTVTINTKYAIACASCQNGYYIEEQQKDDILYGRAIATITEQGAVLLKKEKIIDAPENPEKQENTEKQEKQEKPSLPQNSQAERQTQSAQQNTLQDTQQDTLVGQQARAGQPRRRFCGRCGSPLDGQTGRCPVCDKAEDMEDMQTEEFDVEKAMNGADFTLQTKTITRTGTAEEKKGTAEDTETAADTDTNAAAHTDVVQRLAGKLSRKICPVCGLLFSGDKTTCPVCGSGLEDRK